MLKELETVILTTDLPEHGLSTGDIGAIVLVHPNNAYEVEFVTLEGDTVAIITLTHDQVRPAAEGEIAHARAVESS